MVPLTPEQIAYKEKTLSQLSTNLPELEARFQQENQPEARASLEKQIDDTQAHLELLQSELAAGIAREPVADQLCQRIAEALVKEKFYMARKYITKLETIEPFYPKLDRLRTEAEAERPGRRTRSIAEGTALPYGAALYPPASSPVEGVVGSSLGSSTKVAPLLPTVKKERRISQFFQFHIVASCLVILLIVCVMLGIGGISVLQWLIEGG
jgi:hypothetical protein